MISFDEMGDWLDEMAEEFPQELYQELNGGISLLPQAMEDPAFPPGEIFILGEYCHDEMGRYINLYYGSFAALYGQAGIKTLRRELKTTLAHELTHHIESLAGERGLEIQDEIEMEQFLKDYQ